MWQTCDEVICMSSWYVRLIIVSITIIARQICNKGSGEEGRRGGGGCGYTVIEFPSEWNSAMHIHFDKKKKKMSISVFKRSFNHHSSGIDVIKKYWRILTRILSAKSLEFRNKFKSEITILWNISKYFELLLF